MNETKSSENKDECDTTKDKGESNVFLNKVIGVKEGEESIDKTFCVISCDKENEDTFKGQSSAILFIPLHVRPELKILMFPRKLNSGLTLDFFVFAHNNTSFSPNPTQHSLQSTPFILAT